MKRFAGFVLVLTMVGCTLGGDTRKVIQDGIAENQGHMNDASLPEEARLVATDNHDLLWAVLYREGVVDELPADVRARSDARKPEAPTGGGQ
jgi:hypothetical protein